MACESRTRQVALVARSSGIPAASSRGGFYTALAAGTILGALFMARWLRRREKRSQKISPIPTLTGQPRLAPIPADKLNNRQCAGCQSSARNKRGLWYAIRDSNYCPDCSPAAARKGGFSLALPSSETFGPLAFNAAATRPVAVTLKPGRVRVGPTEMEGYTVLRTHDRRETGLTITPAYKIDSSGHVQANNKSWFVNYDRVGQPVGGPFQSRKEAQGLASELARFDWNRAIEEFSDEEIRESVKLANNYRETLGFGKYMANIEIS
jgi:hypothetical protein